MLDEFFCIAFYTTLYEAVEALQADLDAWLMHYNYERPHEGFRSLGKRPYECIEEHLAGQQNFPPVLEPPAVTVDQPRAQPQSRAFSKAALDCGKHWATLDPVTGGNGSSREVVKVPKSKEKSQLTGRGDG